MRIWIGGGPCSGKSSVANAIGHRLGALVYHADDHFADHAAGAHAGSSLHRVASTSFAELFIRPAEVMLEDFIAVSREEFPMILADVRAVEDVPVVVEGCAILPSLVVRELRTGDRALVLHPEEAFQRRAYAARPWAQRQLDQVADPAGTWERWRVRDAAFAEIARREAADLGIPIISVDGSASVERVTQLAWETLGCAGA